MEDMEKDYEKRSELDRYDNIGIDDDRAQELSLGGRQEAEAELEMRERQRNNL